LLYFPLPVSSPVISVII
jgi:hypothetical protein